MFSKSTWKVLMYSDPKWWIIGKSSGSKNAEQAADEYEEEVLPTLGFIAALVIVAAGILGLLKLFGAI